MMNISIYTPDRQQEWDAFVRESKNGTFLIERGYMDYHSDRFADHSLMFRDDAGHLLAVMPANIDGNELWSHQGLTYGGLILSPHAHASDVGQMFDTLKDYMQGNGISCLHYKCVPSIYHRMPSEEDEYWLWRNGASVEACNLSAAVNLAEDTIYYRKRRRTNCNKLQRMGYTINRSAILADFWPVLTDNLMKSYGAKPVHTFEEMQRLQMMFPDNIVCWTISSPEGEVMGGTILYITDSVVHTQYISASERGKQEHVMDYLLLSAVTYYKEQALHRYFDFGTSNEQGGRILNESLIMQKEGFGGRGITYMHYKL